MQLNTEGRTHYWQILSTFLGCCFIAHLPPWIWSFLGHVPDPPDPSHHSRTDSPEGCCGTPGEARLRDRKKRAACTVPDPPAAVTGVKRQSEPLGKPTVRFTSYDKPDCVLLSSS